MIIRYFGGGRRRPLEDMEAWKDKETRKGWEG